MGADSAIQHHQVGEYRRKEYLMVLNEHHVFHKKPKGHVLAAS
ncbi:MAG TPA: hypothetical protein VF373_13225 [Prolixibacteraceae bacterium]